MKLRVLLSQVNHVYGRGAFLPYSAGLLQSYVQKDAAICSEYEFLPIVFRRENIEDLVRRSGRIDVFAGSTYIWNSTHTLALAKAVKEANPRCLIVLGGPHVPVQNEVFLRQHPYADLLVHYEGEQTLRDILNNLAFSGRRYDTIPGLSVNCPDGVRLVGPSRERLHDLDDIPSPYLTGVFDDLLKQDYDFLPTLEGNRGCVYGCTFCDWGSALLAKIKKHSDPYLEEEIDWFGRRGLSMIYGADANTGILERDLRLVEFMVKTKEKYGFPTKFRAAYAKNNVDRVFEINRVLARAGMSKGATLSFQSMDENVLDLIKRKNIGTERYAQLMKRYNQENIPTYSEIIIGLPGETYDTFADGLDTLLNAGAHASISVYTAELLPNSEMSSPEQRAKHGIVGVKSPIPFYHAVPELDQHQEYYELVVSTNSMSHEEWLEAHLFSWAVQAFHCLGATQACAIHLRHRDGISYRRYYEALLRFAKTHPNTFIGQLWKEAFHYFSDVQQGEELQTLTHDALGRVSWPPEEWAFLLTVMSRWQFYDELPDYLTSPETLNYQKACLSAPLEGTLTKPLPLGFPEQLEKMRLGDPWEDTANNEWVEYEFVPRVRYQTVEEFAQQEVWFNRKSNVKRVGARKK